MYLSLREYDEAKKEMNPDERVEARSKMFQIEGEEWLLNDSSIHIIDILVFFKLIFLIILKVEQMEVIHRYNGFYPFSLEQEASLTYL